MNIHYIHEDSVCKKAETAKRISNRCWDEKDYEGYTRWRKTMSALLEGDRPSDVGVD